MKRRKKKKTKKEEIKTLCIKDEMKSIVKTEDIREKMKKWRQWKKTWKVNGKYRNKMRVERKKEG